MIHLLEPRLRLLQEQIGAPLGLTYDQPGLGLRRVLHLRGQPLRGEQRVAQVVLALAVLGQQRLDPDQIAAEPIDLAHRVLVVVGRLGQKGDDIGPVVAAQRGPEPLLAHVHGADPHDTLGRLRRGGVVSGERG